MPCHLGFSTVQLTTWHLISIRVSKGADSVRERQSENSKGGTGLCIPVSEGTSHYLCFILFIRKKSVGPAHAQKERITQEGHGYQKAF